jgi:putative CocE/NonD family hydrolase
MKSLISIEKSAPIEMRDGTVLRADIYRLADDNKHPVILMRTPYPRQRSADSAYLNVTEVVLAGYAFVVQSIRGTSDSEGKWEEGDIYSTAEGPDGYDTVEYLASQKWCDGNVGTAGVSYCGNLQWILARENPPHLRAMAPWSCGTAGQAETTLLTGATELGGMLNWTIQMGMDVADRMEREGRDVSQMRRMLSQALEDPAVVYNHLPLNEVPHFNFDGVRDIWINRVLHPIPGLEYMEKGRPDYARVNVPCFHISGWYDYFTWGTFHSFQQMRSKGGSPTAREGQHILVGPWGHLGPVSKFGAFAAVDFGVKGGLGAGLSAANISFFDKYLRGLDIKLPAVRYFTMGTNTWREANAWPLPGTQWWRYYLHSRGRANKADGDGLLNRDEPGTEPADVFVYNPLRPVPTIGRRGRESSGFVPGPLEQSPIERRDDVLCYSTPELGEDTEITGPLELHLFAASSARDTDFCAKLCDVYPDGRSFNVATGIIRARYRRSYFKPEFITPGDVYEYTINLGNTSQVFKKGHRLRIVINSSNFPEWDRNMNTGNPTGEDESGVLATQTVYHQTEYASYIDLPLIM